MNAIFSNKTNQLLSNHPLMVFKSVEDANQALSSIYADIIPFEPENSRSALKGCINGVQLPRFNVTYTYFNIAYSSGKKEPMDFHTLQLALPGKHIYSTRNRQLCASQKRSIMLSAGMRPKTYGTDHNGVLSFVISDKELRNSISAYIGHKKFAPIRFAPEINLSAQKSKSLMSILNTFTLELNRSDGILEAPPALANFENLLISTLLFGLDHSLKETLTQPAPLADISLVKKVEGYLEANAHKALDMRTLAGETAHSINSIYRSFKKYRGYTPMIFLQKIRFAEVRKRLLNANPEDTVTSIAMTCGFFHMSRFAAAYKQRFSENPSDTLKINKSDRKKRLS